MQTNSNFSKVVKTKQQEKGDNKQGKKKQAKRNNDKRAMFWG